MKKVLKIGTRASLLAQAQAKMVQARLLEQGIDSELVLIKTLGDQLQDCRLADLGGKALFTKEIERALLEGEVDLAVHSMKDVEAVRPKGLLIPAMLEREDPRDAFLSKDYARLTDLPAGARLGTCSPRRSAQALALNPDLKIVLFRGNIHSRLEKLARQEVDATFLAVAGLKRAGLEQHIKKILSYKEMLPAAGQGAIGIECLESRHDLIEILTPLDHRETSACVTLERAFLMAFEGNCHTPVGVYAEKKPSGFFQLHFFVASEDGRQSYRESFSGEYETLLKRATYWGGKLKKWYKDLVAANPAS